ncbi:hypothetical protein GHT06_015190 [Daphnia sinensis]|uniref:Uncharacterized protein n=1 Tax=Daphnia sinensis TaxID=1820382 RepID=A0AAD5LAL6_9CRUS|nr:hypothetical protein GHT06_015190 [Daphnia sinensis]
MPIGTTAANKQSPFLMHMEYHSPESVGFTGPTFIGIGSGKHSSSTTLSHAVDFESLNSLAEFESFAKVGVDKLLKPVLVFSVVVQKKTLVIDVSIHHFLRHNQDAILLLAMLMAGHFGSHLNNSGLTYAGETLAEICSGSMRTDHLETRSIESFLSHERRSQYFTQIVKCEDTGRCSKPTGSYFTVMPSRFYTPLIPLSRLWHDFGLIVPERGKFESHKFPSVFVGQFCPSIQSLIVVQCLAILTKHMTIHREQAVSLNAPKTRPMRVAARHQRELMAVIAEEELDLAEIPAPNDEAIPPHPIPVYSIDQHLFFPWRTRTVECQCRVLFCIFISE